MPQAQALQFEADVYTNTVTNINANSATGNGEITNTGNDNPERFIEWGTESGNYTAQCSAGIGGLGTFSCAINGLNTNTTYYYRAKAINSSGTSYGGEFSFTTAIATPIVSTNVATNINADSATGNGEIANTGGNNPERFIEWGTESGNYTAECSAGTGSTGTFFCAMSGLNSTTTYYYRAKATNSAGTSYGSELSFTTTNGTPNVPILKNLNDGLSISETTLTLNFDLDDPDTDELIKYQLQIDNNSDFSSLEIDYTESSFSTSPRLNEEYNLTLANGTYYWRVKAIDDEGLESDWSTATNGFKIDVILPESTILYPQNGANLKKVNLICGKSTDNNGVDFTRISIYDQVSKKYYDGTAFNQTSETWLMTTATNS